MQRIFALGEEVGDPDGCVVCHGGSVDALTADEAHQGTSTALRERGGPDEFFADPASPWVNAQTCGQCHAEQVRSQWSSLMMSEAGKIQGTTWSFGSLEGYDHRWANYDFKPSNDPHDRLGTDAYRAYMTVKKEAHPNVFVDTQETLPAAPGTPGGIPLAELAKHPDGGLHVYSCGVSALSLGRQGPSAPRRLPGYGVRRMPCTLWQ